MEVVISVVSAGTMQDKKNATNGIFNLSFIPGQFVAGASVYVDEVAAWTPATSSTLPVWHAIARAPLAPPCVPQAATFPKGVSNKVSDKIEELGRQGKQSI